MRVFITGGTGLIGTAVVAELVRNGHAVVGLARSDESAAALSAAGAESVRGGLADLDAVRTGAAGADGVIHLAFANDFSSPEALAAAVAEAASYDPKVVIEAGIDARELECGVLGNDQPEVSAVGEVIPSHEWYDYADKYVDDGVRTVIPAPLSPEVTDEARLLAARTFRAIDAAGMARVDFFLERGTDRLYVNEINTIPGFTSASMFPRLWEAAGKPLATVVERLLELAIARHRAQAARRLSFTPPSATAGRQPASVKR